MPILPEPVNGAGEEQAGPASDGSEPDLEREVRQARKYSMEDAIGRLAGPGSLKGASPVSRQQQAEKGSLALHGSVSFRKRIVPRPTPTDT